MEMDVCHKEKKIKKQGGRGGGIKKYKNQIKYNKNVK